MTNKQSWADYEIIMHHLLTDEQFGSLDPWMRNFIRQLLTNERQRIIMKYDNINQSKKTMGKSSIQKKNVFGTQKSRSKARTSQKK
jgi:ABC-type thiamine transport system ATPase subunit